MLADHMIPAALVPLSALPLTPLGKVDRKALSRIEYLGEIGSGNHVAPRDETEQILAFAWSAKLGLQRVGVHDNFFEIGGDSILTIQIIAELRKAGIKVAPKQFFLYPTIAGLAAQIQSAESPADQPEANPLAARRAEQNLPNPKLKII